MMVSMHGIFLVSLLWRCLLLSHGQEVPNIACPQYFQYLTIGNQYVGKLSVPVMPQGTNELLVQVHLSQRVPVQGNYYGSISVSDDRETTLNNLRNAIPITYRIDFPIPNVLPKLISLTINGYQICSATPYPSPSTNIDLENHIHATTQFNPLSSPTVQQPLGSSTNQRPLFSPVQNTNVGRPSSRPVTATQTIQQSIIPIIPNINNRANVSLPLANPPLSYVNAANDECGVPSSTNRFQQLIYGGRDVEPGEYPWLTAIYKKSASNVLFLCGGALISLQTVITAAHCMTIDGITSARRVLVYLGRHSLDSYNGVVPRDVNSMIIHEQYDRRKYAPDADLALLHLKEPVSISWNVRPICLWSGPDDIQLLKGTKGYIAGWGEDADGKLTNIPKVVDATIADNEECLRSGEPFNTLTSTRTLCAGNRDGTGPCTGDSGGGLMVKRNGRWILRGIVAAGRDGVQTRCDLTEFVVYCDVAKHLQWVQRNMN